MPSPPRSLVAISLLLGTLCVAAIFSRALTSDGEDVHADTPWMGLSEATEERGADASVSTHAQPRALRSNEAGTDAHAHRPHEQPRQERRNAAKTTLTRSDVTRWSARVDALQEPILDRLRNECATNGEILAFNKRSDLLVQELLRMLSHEEAKDALGVIALYRVNEASRGLERVTHTRTSRDLHTNG